MPTSLPLPIAADRKPIGLVKLTAFLVALKLGRWPFAAAMCCLDFAGKLKRD